MAEKDASDLAVMTFEMLKRIQHDVTHIKEDLHNVKVRLSSVETGIERLNARMDTVDMQLTRIKRRQWWWF
ncbi:MAG: hypothetical protein GDA36_02165 [Rhodobacteraceae bacterium]|nr:hypothetical protein [Paracoccaceae bacterium]